MSAPYPPAAQAARVIIARQALAKLQGQADGLLARIPAAQAALEEEEALLRSLTGHPAAAAPAALLADPRWCAAVLQRLVPRGLDRMAVIARLVDLAWPGPLPAGLPEQVLSALGDGLPPAMPPAPPPADAPAGAAS